MRTALFQVASPDTESPESRLRRVGTAIARETSLRGADLLVLPELWNVGYFGFDEYWARAESLTGPTVTTARGWAVDLGLHVHLGSIVEVDEAGRLYNTTVLIGPDGSTRTTYRKVHVFSYGSREQELLTPGSSVAVATVADIPAGVATCYDLRFPELFRGLVDAGAELLTVCAAWPKARLDHWRLFTSVRAVEQQSWMLACNAVGEQQGVVLGGHSRVVDPTGQVIAEASQDEGFLIADLDTTLPGRTRAEFPALADRRWPAAASTHEVHA
jgi:predicted amidohydrolase